MRKTRMLKILVLALVVVVWRPRVGEASFLDDFKNPTSVNYTGSNSYGSGGSFTVSGGKLNITVGNDNTFSVMTSDAVGFTAGEILSLEVPASSGNHDVFMMCSTTAGQPDGSNTFGFRFRRDGAQYARMNLYPGGIIANTLDPSPDKPATLLVKRISDIDFKYSIKIEGTETQIGSFTLPSLAGIHNLHIGAQAYKLTSDTFAFDNLSIRSSRIHNITKDIWYSSIQESIDGASNGDQIEAVPGTYYEAINFNGKAVHLYSSGGCDVTIINGTGNLHVVQCVSGEGPDTILDGFTVTGGNANGSTNLERCGGGMHNYYTRPTVTNCRFVSNAASLHGGGMHNEHSYPTVTNCSFIGNTAGAHGGGIMNNYGKGDFGGDFFIVNCSFIQNSAGEWGGGCCNAYSSPTIVNCTFTNNIASLDGGGTYNSVNTTMTATNCIYWGNTANEIVNNSSIASVTYSDILGGYSGIGNIDANPIFADANGRLSHGSPCIDTGDNSAVTGAFDLDGNPRVIDGDGNVTAIVDMGAYEIPKAGIKGTVVGVDSAGKASGPLADATVTLSGQETAATATDSNGNFSFLNISAGDYTVTITKSDYYGVNSKIHIEENETLREVFQLAYKSGSQSPVGYDFVSPDGKYFIEGTPGDISFEITIAWNGAAGDVNYCIGNDCYPATVTDLGGGLARASLTIPAPSIVNNSSKLTIDVINGEGKHTYLNTDVRFHPMPEIISSWYKDNIPWMPMPSGLSLSYSDDMSWSWELPLKNKDVSLEASVGYNRELTYDLMSGTFSGSLGGTGGFGLEWPVAGIKVLGEGEAGLAGTLSVGLTDGPPVITPGWQVSFTGKVGVEAPVILVVDVVFPPAAPAVNTMLKIPVVKNIVKALKVRLYIIGGASIEGMYEDLESGDCFLGSTKIDVSGTFGVEIQVEISAWGAAVGVYAGGTGTPSFEICPDFKFNSITIHAYVGAYAKTWWFRISKKYGCTIELGSSRKGIQALSEQLLGAASEGDVTWELASDSLKKWGTANRPVGSEIRKLAFTPKAGGTGSEAQSIAENVIDTASPSVISDASQTMLLFSLHDVDKPDYGASDIGTFISTGGGVWSAGRIADDSTSDFVAKVTRVGSDSYLAAWERISGDVSEVTDPNHIDQINPHLEIAASWFNRNTGVWSALTEVTSNNFVDRAPMPITYGSTTGIVWIQNDVNYIGNSGHGDRLMFTEWTGSAWGTPQQLWSGPYGILSISFASDSFNQGHIVFAVDMDGNIDDTRTDRELYGISTSAGIWGGALRLTNNDVEDSCPVIVNPNGTAIVVWDCNDTLLYTPFGAWNPKQVYSQYTLNNQAAAIAGVTMADGAAIAYTVQSPSGVDIMASFYDAVLDRWSLPRQLTFDEDVESAVSLGFDGDRLIVAYLKTQTERNAVDVEIDGQMHHLENVPEPGRTDLCILQHTLGYDLSVDSNSIVLEPANPKPGFPATIKADVANSGDLGAENIAVAFFNGNPDSGGSIIGDTRIIAGNLIPGGVNKVSVRWDVPADSGNSNEIFVVVDPCLAVNDRDRSNNTASKFAVLPDVEVKNAWSTELSPHSVMLIARIANTGAAAAKNVTVSWRIGSQDGTEIGRDLISALACNGIYEASCVWNVNGVFDGNDYFKVFGVVSSAGGLPDFDERNNAFSLLVNNPAPVSFPLAEAGPDQTVYAWIDGIAEVALDGSDSNDPDGDMLTYKWMWTIEGSTYDANGVRPTIELPVGQHIISLIVNDGSVDSQPDEVVVTVIEPVKGDLMLSPDWLSRTDRKTSFSAVMYLPLGIPKDQVDTTVPMMLYPGGLQATLVQLFQTTKNGQPSTKIFMSFSKSQLMNVIPTNGKLELTIKGKLISGQEIIGKDFMTIKK